MKTETIDMIDGFTKNGEAFTALDISNELKSNGHTLRHGDIAPIVRELYTEDALNNYFNNYIRTEIMVDAEILQDDGDLNIENVTTWLYHDLNFNPVDYTSRALRATYIPVDTDLVDDDDDDDEVDAQIVTEDDPDGAYSYQSYIHNHGVTVYLDALDTRDLKDAQFDTYFKHQEIFLDKTDGKSTVQTTKRGHLRISNADLQRTGLSKFDAVWIHVYDGYIVINELSPDTMELKQYMGDLIKFNVDTPTSKTNETNQTVILQVTGVSATKDCNYLLHGYNIKRLNDDANDLKGALRQYRIDRIDFDTLVKLT